MAKKHKPEEIIAKLREAEVGLAQGQPVGQVARKLGVSEQTYYRWRREYGGLKVDQAKRLKELEKENTELKKMLAEAMRVIIAFSGSNTVDTLLIGISWILTGTPFRKREGVMGDWADWPVLPDLSL